uniref:Uncharacterized protein n=1 Tax=Arundo donax TaxID=35708 RepID=A0A0A9BPV8_ARUDO
MRLNIWFHYIGISTQKSQTV